MGRPHSSNGKESACNAGDQGSIPESGRSFGEGNGNPLQYSSWKIAWTEEPGRLQSVGLQRVRHDWATSTHNTFTYLSFGSSGYSLLLLGLPLVAVSGSYSLLRYMGFSWQWLLWLWTISSWCESSIVAAFGHTGSVVEACRALELRLRSCSTWAELLCSMWDLPGPGIKYMGPSLAGRIIYSMPPVKFYYGFLSLSSWVTALTRKWLDPGKSLPFGFVDLTLSQYYHWKCWDHHQRWVTPT